MEFVVLGKVSEIFHNIQNKELIVNNGFSICSKISCCCIRCL